MALSSWVGEDPVAEVRSRADIVEVIGRAVVLKRSGRNYLGLCPFHGERTPSFNVNPERQIFRCFGCGEGGDVFSFVMKQQSLTFPEALRDLAERYGVTLPDRRPDDDERSLLKDVNEQATGFFRQMLAHPEIGAEARAYLESRGVTPEWQQKFQLGYAPPQWDQLHRFLLQAQVPVGLQEKAALVRARPSGSGHYDYFRHRIIFPIHNEAGHVVGFGARAIAPDDEPKYLNSPETVLYHKGNLLYGLNQARESIKAKDEALLMEGYMDVITAHAFGFAQAVGVLGTALTPAQARMLLRYTPGKRVVIAFDADRAGQQAAERGLTTLTDVAQGVGLEARVLAVPEGKDPDAYLRREGTAAFEGLLGSALPLFEYQIDRALLGTDLRSAEGRAKAVTLVVPILRNIGNYVTQDGYVKRVCQRLGVREESLRLEITRGMRHNVTPSRGGPVSVKKLSSREAERILLYHMVEQAAVRGQVEEQLGSIAFEPVHQEVREAIAALAAERSHLVWGDVLDRFAGSDETTKTISAIMFSEYANWDPEGGRIVEDSIKTLLYEHWHSVMVSLTERVKAEEKTLEPAAYQELLNRHREVEQYLRELKHKRSNLLTPAKSTE